MVESLFKHMYVSHNWLPQYVPSGYLAVRHGKIHHAIKNGKPSISMGHLYHGYVSHNQRVDAS